MSRIFYQILYILWDACHEVFCVFGDFEASGMQHAEVTKSLRGFFFYLTNTARVPQPVVLNSLNTGMTLSTVYLLCCKYTTRSRSSKLDSWCEQIKFQDAWSTFKSGVLRNKHFLIFITQKNFEKNNITIHTYSSYRLTELMTWTI